MLVLVRHGRTLANLERRLVGRSDPPLDDVGRDQARAIAAVLGDVVELRTSPLSRAMETASLLGSALPLVVDEDFVELDYGELEGTAVDAVDPVLWAKVRADASVRFPGGESLEGLQRRVERGLDVLFGDTSGAARRADGDVVVVSHVGPIKAAVAWAVGAEPTAAFRMRLDNGSITRIAWGPGGAQLVGYNEVPVAAPATSRR